MSYNTNGGPHMWIVMSSVYESWGPVAAFPTKEEATKFTDVMNRRLFGRHLHVEFGFRVCRVAFSPAYIDTGKKRYHAIDPDDPEWITVFDVEGHMDVMDGDPVELLDVAMMLERGTMKEQDIDLREEDHGEADK